MSEERKKPVWPWIAALLIGLPTLYVLSSGPMQTLAFRSRTVTFSVPADSLIGAAETVFDQGAWWPKIYAPLIWVVDQEWGEPIAWYWRLFPIADQP